MAFVVDQLVDIVESPGEEVGDVWKEDETRFCVTLKSIFSASSMTAFVSSGAS
ncbi:MAG: hypothetical protein ACLTQI_07010 [Slackia sp.]